MAVHDGEFQIDDELVAGLTARQMPEWSHLPLRRLDTAGTVNVAYRLGKDMLVRLPRLAGLQNGPLRESRWLPEIAPAVPLEIPEYLALGAPTDEYPSPWSVLGWIDGENAVPSALSDTTGAARRLGEFVLALRGVSTDDAPDGNSRGRGLASMDTAFRDYLTQFRNSSGQPEILRTWEACLAAPEWDGPPTWFHSDLHSGNLLARAGELVAVIDFEGCSVGDPSSDLIAAWWMFDADSRPIFRDTIQPDEAQWIRGMGWALYMTVAAIPYHTDTNPEFAAMARSALDQIRAS
jgi:aminoglycoside phosphotransferase (APT) family kinase protein